MRAMNDRRLLPLPPRVLQGLRELARKYHREGARLFVFGSFANGKQRPTSDLDLGVEWHGEPRPEVFLRLYWEVQDLPTVRKIDVVDFSQVTSGFKEAVAAEKIYLLEGEEKRKVTGWDG